jgi:hypothetical protein
MCGIWNIISLQPKNQKPSLYPSFMEIHPRGPETFTFQCILENIYLGFHRLAIHGLTSLGNQPFIKKLTPTKTIY